MKTLRMISTLVIGVTLAFTMFILDACTGKNNLTEESHYMDFETEIVTKRLGSGRHGEYKIIVVRMISDTTMYAEITGGCCSGLFDNGKYYNWQVGDTLHWDYLRKERFFKLENGYHE